MVEGRRGLGRGLSALMNEAEPAPAGDSRKTAGVVELPIELIRRNPDQPRRTFEAAALQELTESILERGVLSPILVRPTPDGPGGYQIVTGERRWRASQKAAEKLLEDDAYEAACSDAHKPRDVDDVVRAIARLEKLVGAEEAMRLLSTGPRGILEGRPRDT